MAVNEFDEGFDAFITDVREEPTQVLQVPAPLAVPTGTSAYLIVLASPGSTGKMFRLEPGQRILGRAHGACVRLESRGISRHHAKLHVDPDGAVLLEDLGSKNGTFVQGEVVKPGARLRLKDGDKLQIGDSTILKLSYQDSLDLEFQQTMYASATRDAMTGAFNRRYFDESLPKEFSFSVRHGLPLSLVILDIDRFKHINDTWGHLAGDHALVEVAHILGSGVRSEDVFARIGGEEFALLLRDCPHQNALALAERMRARIEHRIVTYEGRRLPITLSAGVSTLVNRCHPDARHLIADADSALYQAKRNGRNRVESGERSLRVAPSPLSAARGA